MRGTQMTPKIGLLPTGHKIYWGQFPGLRERGELMYQKLLAQLSEIGTVIASDLVDTAEKAEEAAVFFEKQDIDLLLIFPLGYTTGMCVAPVVRALSVPIRILNAHEDSSYDYKNSDTEFYLHHEAVCCVPEYAGTLVSLGKAFKVITGHFGDERLWTEVREDCKGAAAANAFRKLHFGVIGNTYTNMTDMPTDELRVLRATGRLLCRPEIEEIEEAYKRVTEEQILEMLDQFEQMYDIENSVNKEHLRLSARIAVAYDEIIRKYDLSAFGYYWWGEKEEITQLRAQSALAVSRLAALGRPGVTEGDVKTAMAMKVFDLLGAGGMFLELFCMDFDENFIMVGHDGPSNINVASGKPKIKHLDVHHGKTGSGIGIDFHVAPGPVTLLNLTQFGSGDTFKLIYTVGEVVEGDILNIGNPNCRVRVEKPIPQFMNDWCQQGPSHHLALGLGDQSAAVETFAEAMGFQCVRV